MIIIDKKLFDQILQEKVFRFFRKWPKSHTTQIQIKEKFEEKNRERKSQIRREKFVRKSINQSNKNESKYI